MKKIGLDGGFSEDPDTHEIIAGKPLLKEVNLSGIQFTSAVTFPIDLSSAEKLKVFKALKSNLLSVTFADGVALNTLYLPYFALSYRFKYLYVYYINIFLKYFQEFSKIN